MPANTAANEAIQIAKIIVHLRTGTAAGQKMKAAFLAKFGCAILDVRERGGNNRGTHYDFDVQTPEGWKHVEHKGSYKLSAIKDSEVPWATGVQFYNGGCEKFEVTRAYAKLWYDTYIVSGTLKAAWGIVAPVPSFDEWLKGDCCKQGDPTTPFGKELKKKVRAERLIGSLLEARAPVVNGLVINENQLKFDVSKLANEVLDQKDYWMDVRGDVDGEFNVAWYPKYTITEIESVTVTRAEDIKFRFNCAGGMSFNGILRWGKGAGFSCLRLDLK